MLHRFYIVLVLFHIIFRLNFSLLLLLIFLPKIECSLAIFDNSEMAILRVIRCRHHIRVENKCASSIVKYKTRKRKKPTLTQTTAQIHTNNRHSMILFAVHRLGNELVDRSFSFIFNFVLWRGSRNRSIVCNGSDSRRNAKIINRKRNNQNA